MRPAAAGRVSVSHFASRGAILRQARLCRQLENTLDAHTPCLGLSGQCHADASAGGADRRSASPALPLSPVPTVCKPYWGVQQARRYRVAKLRSRRSQAAACRNDPARISDRDGCRSLAIVSAGGAAALARRIPNRFGPSPSAVVPKPDAAANRHRRYPGPSAADLPEVSALPALRCAPSCRLCQNPSSRPPPAPDRRFPRYRAETWSPPPSAQPAPESSPRCRLRRGAAPSPTDKSHGRSAPDRA